MSSTERIPPCSARALELDAGDTLVVIDPEGQQVCDMVAFAREDLREHLSSGRSIDYRIERPATPSGSDNHGRSDAGALAH